MLKARIIPTLLLKKFGLVKGVGFDSWRRVGPTLPAIKVYNQREVDELILVDIVAHQRNEELDIEEISDFSEECFVPLTVGGGITILPQVQRLLRSGADKVCVNSASYSNPELITEIADRHGSQCIVASIDTRTEGRNWRCYSHSGQMETRYLVQDWAKEVENRGAGEILLTSIERDGTLTGYDLALIHAVTSVVDIPVIASGGAGNYEHLIKAIVDSGASAVAAASMFHFTEQTPQQARESLREAGVPVRSVFTSEDRIAARPSPI